MRDKFRKWQVSCWPLLLLLPFAAIVLPAGQTLAGGIREVAPGIYLRPGAQEDAGRDNGGAIANLGFIVGERQVAVIDTGGSLAEGQWLSQRIREVTSLPVAWVILSHMHPDHVLGAAAFEEDHPVYVGHAQLADALRRRSTFYLDAARRVLGEKAEGTRIMVPTRQVEVGSKLELDLGGRILEVQAHPTAHTNNDLTIYDRRTRTLWVSDLLFVERLPVIDGSLKGWLDLLDDLSQRRDVARMIPGHGPVPVDWKGAIAAERRYLVSLLTGIRKVIRRGGTIEEAIGEVGKLERDKWLLYEAYHGRNVTAAFVELEWE